MASVGYGEVRKSDLLRELVEKFGQILNIGTIHEVAKQKNYDVHESNMALLELTAYKSNMLTYKDTNKNNSMNQIRIQHEKESRIINPQNYISTFAIEDTIADILKNYKILVILRGLPGSGKSYLARCLLYATIQSSNYSDHIISADNFFMMNGKYFYDVTKIDEAHHWAKKEVFKKMVQGYSPLVVDNTNVQLWEMQPYAKMAVQCGYKVRILEASTKWSFDCKQLAMRNEHGVPQAKIKMMLNRYDKNVTPEILLASCNLSMVYQTKPHLRTYPPVIEADLNVPSVSSMDTSIVHNHNSMNPDLTFLDSRETTQHRTTALNSQCEVSNSIEISDDDDDANSKVPEENLAPKIRNEFQPENIDYAAWGVDENILRSWNIVTPLETDGDTVLVDSASDHESDKQQPQICEKGVNTCLEDFHRKPEGLKILNAYFRDINPIGKKLRLSKYGMLDKSCSTQDVVHSDRDEDLRKLADIFQTIPPLYIRDMYDNCNGNFDMAFEIFLEDGKDYSDVVLISDLEDDMNQSQSKKPKINYEEQVESCSVHNSSPEKLILTSSSKTSLKTGSVPKELELPSTSGLASEESSTDVIVLNSDSDPEYDNTTSQGDNDIRSEDSDIMEINLGNGLIEQLEKEFGDPMCSYPKGFQPVIQLPKAFARQLYAFYVESVYQQMDAQKCVLNKLLKEDELFARKLYEEENGLCKEPKPETFQEIMNEQVAMSIHKQEISQGKNLTPDNLASHLTKKKLFETFPTVEKSTLIEIYHANGQNYQQTVEDLLVAVDPTEVHNIRNMKDSPISEPTLLEMEKALEECTVNEDRTDEGSSESYRDEANSFLKKREELYRKAQEYYSQGQREVAQFYSELAKKQTQYYEIANNKAAARLLEEHSKRLQNFDTLDLHFLFVKEALAALDVFIDRNVNLLKGGSKASQNLLIITGRGNRSKNGTSKIRPAVLSRLKARNILYVYLNPGLLKIKINRNTIMTSDL